MKNFLLGTVIFLLTVPFCFAQENTYPRMRVSHELLQDDYSLTVFSSTPSVSFLGSGKLSGARLKYIYRVDAIDSLRTDTTLRKPIEKKFRMKKSPWLAVGLSALLPGAGQFYNRSFWKVPIVLGLVGYLGYQFYDNDKKYRDYRDRYSATQTVQNPSGDENLKILREFYFDQRNDFVWYFTIVYVINLVDAYVDAHLFDFDVREEKLTRFGKTDKQYKLNVRVKL